VTANPKSALTIMSRIAIEWPEEIPAIESLLRADFRRLSPAAVEVAIETGGCIGPMLGKLFGENPDAKLAERIWKILPERTRTLRDLALRVAEQRLANLSVSSETRDLDRAVLLNDLSSRLNEAGKRARARKTADEALALCDELLLKNPSSAIIIRIAMVLALLSHRYMSLALPSKSFEISNRMYAAVRSIPESDLEGAPQGVIDIFVSHSSSLLELGDVESAVAVARDALRLPASHAEKPMVLAILAEGLLRAGQPVEAAEIAAQILPVCLSFSRRRVAVQRTEICSILSWAAHLLRFADRVVDAHSAAVRASQLIQTLPKDQLLEIDWARVRLLATRAWCERRLGRSFEAVEFLKQAINQVRETSGLPLTQVQADLASLATDLCLDHFDSRLFGKSLELVIQAVALFDVLPKESRVETRLALFGVSVALANAFSSDGQPVDAIRAARAGESIFDLLSLQEQEARKNEWLLGVCLKMANQVVVGQKPDALATGKHVARLLAKAPAFSFARLPTDAFVLLLTGVDEREDRNVLAQVLIIARQLLLRCDAASPGWQRLHAITSILESRNVTTLSHEPGNRGE